MITEEDLKIYKDIGVVVYTDGRPSESMKDYNERKRRTKEKEERKNRKNNKFKTLME